LGRISEARPAVALPGAASNDFSLGILPYQRCIRQALERAVM
jgi:hypothetical protein